MFKKIFATRLIRSFLCMHLITSYATREHLHLFLLKFGQTRKQHVGGSRIFTGYSKRADPHTSVIPTYRWFSVGKICGSIVKPSHLCQWLSIERIPYIPSHTGIPYEWMRVEQRTQKDILVYSQRKFSGGTNRWLFGRLPSSWAVHLGFEFNMHFRRARSRFFCAQKYVFKSRSCTYLITAKRKLLIVKATIWFLVNGYRVIGLSHAPDRQHSGQIWIYAGGRASDSLTWKNHELTLKKTDRGKTARFQLLALIPIHSIKYDHK